MKLHAHRFAELPETAAPALAAHGLSCARGGRAVIDRLEMIVHAGDSVAIRGLNGAGKTTLLNCLTARCRITSGTVQWFGRLPQRSPWRNRLIGFAGHDLALYPELTARDQLLFAARMYGLDAPRVAAESALDEVGLLRQGDQLACRLSRGMRQRLALARAFIHEPSILILDEPFTSLDADGQEWLGTWLAAQQSRDRAIIWTTHDGEQARRLASRTLELRNGRLFDAPCSTASSLTISA